MLKVIRFLELMWLVIAIVSAVIATYHLVTGILDHALFFYFFSAVAVALFFLRKRQRTKLEDN
ncbi:MAG: hypothetical protein J5I47_08195 [Vicingus serpentipes]|nr:hypothetical protein [Vicingus serpentipes]